MDSWKAREIRTREGGTKNGWTDPGAKWSTGPGPGVKRSTELFLAQDRRPAEKRLIHYVSGRERERTNPEVK